MKIEMPKKFQIFQIPKNFQISQINEIGKELHLSEPDQIRYLLIVSQIASNKDEWNKRFKDPTFYRDSLYHIKKWCNMTDEEIHNLHKSLPVHM